MIRLKDIAAMAQVSIGTVDRVIHQRGRVSPAAKERVMKVLERHHYKPNIIGKALRSTKTVTLAAFLPDPALSSYWIKSIRGIHEAADQLGPFGVKVIPFVFDPYRPATFQQQAKKVLEAKPDGILLAPSLKQEALDFSQTCRHHQIPLVCFNTYIDSLHPLSFIGQDLHESGRLAAELMTTGQTSGSMLIVHIREKAPSSMHIYKKEEGFREFIAQYHAGQLTVITLSLTRPEAPGFEKKLEQSLKQYPDTQGLFVTTSKAYYVAQFLEKAQKTDLRLIGYDLMEENLPYLRRGTIDMLIHQNAEKQSFLGISYLADHLVFNKEIPSIRHLPLSVITKENLNSYLHADLN